MKIGYFQFDIKYGDKEANLKKVEQAIEKEDFDLLVLPELFSTGCMFKSRYDAYSLAEKIPVSETVRRMMQWAERKSSYILGGLAELEKGRIFNTAVVVGPAGYLKTYRKIYPSLTEGIYTPGEEFVSFDWKGVRFGIAICNDGTIEETYRQYHRRSVDLILHPSNFLGKEMPATVEKFVNQYKTPVLTVNRLGFDVEADFDIAFLGESRLVGIDQPTTIKSGKQEELRVFEFCC